MSTTRTPPGETNPPIGRELGEVTAAATAAQANVVQLRTADTKRRRPEPSDHEIRTPSPGAVVLHREMLIDHRRIREYTDAELALRLREAWGQFCLFCWSLHVEDPHQPPIFASLTGEHPLRCPSALNVKEAELSAMLWRLKFEQRLRHDPGSRGQSEFDAARSAAQRIPVTVFSKGIDQSDMGAIVACSCEHAGMLAAVRWIADRQWNWGDEGIMDVDEREMIDSFSTMSDTGSASQSGG